MCSYKLSHRSSIPLSLKNLPAMIDNYVLCSFWKGLGLDKLTPECLVISGYFQAFYCQANDDEKTRQ